MKESEIRKLIKQELNDFAKLELDDILGMLLKKKSGKTHEELLNGIKNSFDVFFKVLWQKKDFWKSSLK